MSESMSEEKKQETPVVEAVAMRETNESFLGSILVLVLVILLIGVTTFFGFLGYRIWRESQLTKSTPSIQKIVEAPALPAPTTNPTPSEEPKPETPAASVAAVMDKATLDIKVMNGGAVKGSAGTFGETLKKAGYTKVTVGNTSGDYTGTVVYYATDKQKEAESVLVDVLKTYPKATVAPAKAGIADMTGATLVVILGK